MQRFFCSRSVCCSLPASVHRGVQLHPFACSSSTTPSFLPGRTLPFSPSRPALEPRTRIHSFALAFAHEKRATSLATGVRPVVIERGRACTSRAHEFQVLLQLRLVFCLSKNRAWSFTLWLCGLLVQGGGSRAPPASKINNGAIKEALLVPSKKLKPKLNSKVLKGFWL